MTRKNRRAVPPKRQREFRRHGCWDHLIVAPLWAKYSVNLGTLLRTCDAVGACMAVPASRDFRKALDRGDTLPRRPHLHWINGSATTWIRQQRGDGKHILAVEVADDALPLTLLEPAREPTVLLLGNEGTGIPDEALDMADQCIQIPMIGIGLSLNVSVAGSLVAYRLAGLS